MDSKIDEIIRMSFPYFANKEVTPRSLYEFIDRMKLFYGIDQLDIESLFKSLESAHSVTILEEMDSLDDYSDHLDWFNPSANVPLHREFPWHYWQHYKDYLTNAKRWNSRLIGGLDDITSQILSRIEDPIREGTWDRRGMVVGSVQSGKTANYTALITKAADAGYKLIVVLAGVHNSLRSQTQYRLNEEFLGYDLQKVQLLTDDVKRIGVGRMFRDHKAVYTLTHSGENGDFKHGIASQAGIFPNTDGPPLILIIKKHVSIMRNLIEWISNTIAEPDQDRRRIVKNIPFLLIDDECDYATINTGVPERDENGVIIEEWDPSKTNMRIRQLLNLFRKSIYIGYTATPFANVFIHHNDPHPTYGEDLFPRSFILNLPQPSNYIGPEKLFGFDLGTDENDQMDPLPLVRIIDDYETEIPERHRSTTEIVGLPDSLIQSIKCFLLVCAARSLRKEGTPHNTMLIHVTRYTAVQSQVNDLIRAELLSLTARIMSGSDPLSDFRELWEDDFIPTMSEMANNGFIDSVAHKWEHIKLKLYETTKRIQIKLLNGLSTDTLEYREAEIKARNAVLLGQPLNWEDQGAYVIAIGGDKLSRGLTLDGLSVSYFLRVSSMYDTLMQMGRWFGYRTGFNDLCRIYTTQELNDWYRHIAGATVELKNELNYMALKNSDPTEFGLKVRNHPGRLSVTSTNKLRSAERIRVSFAGRSQEQVVFNPKSATHNLMVLERLVSVLNPSACKPVDPKKPRYHWSGVDSGPIISFLREYKAHNEAIRIVNPERHAAYIEQQNNVGELIRWDIVIVSTANSDHPIRINGLNINCVMRNPTNEIQGDRISIKRLLSPSDEWLDFTESEKNRVRQLAGIPESSNKIPKSMAIRDVRPADRGLLLIYLPWGGKNNKQYGGAGQEIVAYGLSFPSSDNATDVEYVVNPVYQNEI